MNYLLYLTYGIFHIFPLITKILNQDDFDLEFFNFFGSIFFFIVIVDDYIIFISEIATTKFCEYSLRTSLLGYFCTWFYVPKRKKVSSEFNSNNSKNDLTSFQTDLTSSCSSLISNNIYDKELVSIYKNKIFFEDYFMGYFDQILNIITSSLYQVYNSKYFSTQANEQNLTKKLKIRDEYMTAICIIDIGTAFKGDTIVAGAIQVGGGVQIVYLLLLHTCNGVVVHL